MRRERYLGTRGPQRVYRRVIWFGLGTGHLPLTQALQQVTMHSSNRLHAPQ